MQRLSTSICLLHVALSVALMATTTPVAARVSSRTDPAPPLYAPPYPRPAVRPLDASPRSGVTYRDRTGFRPARTNIGTSAHDPMESPGLWAGLYLGLDGGYGAGTTRLADSRFATAETHGAIGGAHIGRLWQTGRFVYGGEIDVSRDAAHGSRRTAGGFDLAASRDWTGSARLRAGLSLGSWLVYGTVGAAAAGHRVSATDGASRWSANSVHPGFVYGGGLEWQATESISLRGEVLRYEFRDVTSAPLPAIRLDDTVVRAGISYRIN